MVASTKAPPHRMNGRGHGHGGTSSMTVEDPSPKVCNTCGESKPRDQFGRYASSKDGLRGKCRRCHALYMRTYVEANRERVEATRRRSDERRREVRLERRRRQCEIDRESGRIEARHRVESALRVGRLIRPERCQTCGTSGRIEAHHVDYSRPLDVEWLCCLCHRRADGRMY